MWYIPAFPGQEVMLNPDTNPPHHSRLRMKAHIIKELGDSMFNAWSKYSQDNIGGIIVKIQFEDGYVSDYYLKRLLPVGIPDKKYIMIDTNQKRIRGFEEDESFEKELDMCIIKHGYVVHSKKVYDNTYKQRYIKNNIDYFTNIALKKSLTQEQTDAWMELQRVYEALPPSENVETFVDNPDTNDVTFPF